MSALAAKDGGGAQEKAKAGDAGDSHGAGGDGGDGGDAGARAKAHAPAPALSLEVLVAGGGHDGIVDLIVPYLSGHDVFRGLAAASKAFEAAARRGGRRWMKGRYEGGENRRWGMNFLKQDAEAGRADFEDAARWGYRPAVARCKFRAWGRDEDREGAVALWRAELASNPSEKSGGKCRWSAYYLAMCYKVGYAGVEENDVRAAEFYHKAADENGNSVAMFRLAGAYGPSSTLQNVDKDEAKALEYHRKASGAGYAYASGELGKKYEYGELGLNVNLVEAARLYEIAKQRETRFTTTWTTFLGRVQRKIAGTYESSSEENSGDGEEGEEEDEDGEEEEEEGGEESSSEESSSDDEEEDEEDKDGKEEEEEEEEEEE